MRKHPRSLDFKYGVLSRGSSLNDFEATKISLSNVGGSLKLCDNPKLRELGYRRMNFLSHHYFMLYRIKNDTVYIDDIFHELQDY